MACRDSVSLPHGLSFISSMTWFHAALLLALMLRLNCLHELLYSWRSSSLRPLSGFRLAAKYLLLAPVHSLCATSTSGDHQYSLRLLSPENRGLMVSAQASLAAAVIPAALATHSSSLVLNT